MFSFKITKRGDKFAQMERKAPEEAERISSEAAKATVDVARQLVPVSNINHLHLRDTIFHQKLRNARYIVGATAEYAGFVEFGTIYQDAQPYLTPALELARREFEAGLRDFFNRVAA